MKLTVGKLTKANDICQLQLKTGDESLIRLLAQIRLTALQLTSLSLLHENRAPTSDL